MEDKRTKKELVEELTALREENRSLKAVSPEIERVKENLKKSEAQYRAAFECTGTAMMIIERDMTLAIANHRCEDVTGYPQETASSGRKWTEFVVEDELEKMMEYHVARREDPTSVPSEYEFRLKHASGKLKDILLNIAMIPGTKRSLISLIDITERKIMERALRVSEQKFRSIFSESPIGIALFDDLGVAVEINRSFKKMFDMAADKKCDPVGKNLPSFLELSEDDKQRLTHGQSVHVERLCTGCSDAEDAPRRYFDWYLTRLDLQGDKSVLLAQVQDITEAKLAEEAQLNEARNEAKMARSLAEGLRKELAERTRFHDMVSRSPLMQRVFDTLPEVAQSIATVLITGESGTGKELIARSLHNLSPRKQKPFIAVNCSALPDNLLESELFGFKAGAFTDAKKDKLGKFALAEGGTIFLDEIGDITPALQVKLLRVLQEREYEPLGATSTIKANVRVVAATNRDLQEMIAKEEFRQDLYYRIKILTIKLPPLKDRRCDIPILCDYFIERFNPRYHKNVKTISEEALEILLAHQFPGNIRELENIIEHAFIFCKEPAIQVDHLPPEFNSTSPTQSIADTVSNIGSFQELEKLYIQGILQETDGNKVAAAKKLGIHKSTLFRKLKSLGIE